MTRGDEQREPSAVKQLGRGRGEEQQIKNEKGSVDRIDDTAVELPVQGDERRHQGGDHHQQRDGDAVGAGERVRRTEAEDGDDGAAPSAQLTKGM